MHVPGILLPVSGHGVLTSLTMTRTDLVDRHKASELLGVSTRQVLRYVDAGLLTKHRSSSGHVRYSRREIRRIRCATNRRRLLADATYMPVQRAS